MTEVATRAPALGLHKNVPNEVYHSMEAISSTQLVHALRSMRHFHHNSHFNPVREQKEQTAALHFGNAAHCYLLEPEVFKSTYVVAPSKDEYENLLVTVPELKEFCKAQDIKLPSGATKNLIIQAIHDAGAEANIWDNIQAEFEATVEANGQHVVTVEQLQQMVGMIEELKNTRLEDHQGNVYSAGDFFRAGEAEQTFVWQDDETGLLCRCRTDWLINQGNVRMVIDYKTTMDARPHSFQRDAGKLAYYIRAAMYLDGVSKVLGKPFSEFVFITQEKDKPYLPAAYNLTAENIDSGRQLYKQLLRRVAKCVESGYWPGYASRVEPIEVSDGWLNAHYEQAKFNAAA